MAARDAFIDMLSETRRAAAKAEQIYVSSKPQWLGGVERRPEQDYRRKSDVIRRCKNPACREWPIKGSRDSGVCLSCGTPLECD